MSASLVTCTHCRSTLQVGTATPIGRTVRCPQCQTVFKVTGLATVSIEGASTRASGATTPRPAVAERLAEELAATPYDDAYDRPRRKRRRRAGDAPSSDGGWSPLFWGRLLIGGAVFLALASGVIILFLVFWKRGDSDSNEPAQASRSSPSSRPSPPAPGQRPQEPASVLPTDADPRSNPALANGPPGDRRPYPAGTMPPSMQPPNGAGAAGGAAGPGFPPVANAGPNPAQPNGPANYRPQYPAGMLPPSMRAPNDPGVAGGAASPNFPPVADARPNPAQPNGPPSYRPQYPASMLPPSMRPPAGQEGAPAPGAPGIAGGPAQGARQPPSGLNQPPPAAAAAAVPTVPTQGTGFVVASNGYVLTTSQLVHGAGRLLVQTAVSNQSLPAQLVAEDEDHDLALLLVVPAAISTLPPLRLSARALQQDEPVGILGGILPGRASAIQGSNSIVRLLPSAETDQLIGLGTKLDTTAGGGPVFDTFGNVVAVVLNKTFDDGKETINLAVPANTVESFLKSHVKNYKGTPSQKKKSWLEVERLVRPSVVLIQRVRDQVPANGFIPGAVPAPQRP